MTEDLFATPAPPDGWAERARKKGWPDGLLDRALRVRIPLGELDWQLGDEGPDAGEVTREVEYRERLTLGTLQRRAARWSDNDACVDLFANAPEDIDGWEVTVERGPDAFAQFKLQEHVDARLLIDRGVAVAFAVVAGVNCMVDRRRMAVAFSQAFRVRRQMRGGGLSHLIRGTDFPAGNPFYNSNVFYVRSRNLAAVDWMRASNPELLAQAPDRPGDVPGVEARVEQYPRAPYAGVAAACIRPAREDELADCARLVNRTHIGTDLYRPYTADHLAGRLDGWSWAPKPDWFEQVYSRSDFRVLEREGRVVACGGLWDRGRHIRETWRLPGSEESKTITCTALMDFGYEDGHAADMGELIRYFIGETDRLDRDYLLAPLQFVPEVGALLADRQPVPEVRGVVWRAIFESGIELSRPYVDLAYW